MSEQTVSVFIFVPSHICKSRRTIFGGKIKRDTIKNEFKIDNFKDYGCENCEDEPFITMTTEEYFKQDPDNFDLILATDLDLYIEVPLQESLLKILDRHEDYKKDPDAQQFLAIIASIGNVASIVQTLCFNKLVREYGNEKWKKFLEEILNELRK